MTDATDPTEEQVLEYLEETWDSTDRMLQTIAELSASMERSDLQLIELRVEVEELLDLVRGM